MIKDNVRDALNAQMIASSSPRTCTSPCRLLRVHQPEGFAAWLKVQAKEEMEHGMKFYGYLVDQGARITLKPSRPKTEWGRPWMPSSTYWPTSRR